MYICVLYCTCLFPPHSTANLFIVNLMELKFLFLPNIVSKLSILLLHKRLWEAKVGWTAFLYLIVDTWMGEWEAWNEGHSKVMLDWLFNLDSSACAPQRPATWTRPSPSTQPSASAPTTSRSTRRTGRHQNISLHLEHHRLEHSTLCLPDDVALTGFLSEDTRSYAVTLHSKLHLILWFGSMDFVRVQWEDGCTSFNLSPPWLHSRSVLSTAWVLMSAVLMGALNRPAELPAIPAPTHHDGSLVTWQRRRLSEGKFQVLKCDFLVGGSERSTDNSRNQTVAAFLSACRCKTHCRCWDYKL